MPASPLWTHITLIYNASDNVRIQIRLHQSFYVTLHNALTALEKAGKLPHPILRVCLDWLQNEENQHRLQLRRLEILSCVLFQLDIYSQFHRVISKSALGDLNIPSVDEYLE